jgi:hypothetical protein
VQLFKIVIAFLSVGGASYALFRVEKAPTWLKFTSVILALVAMIYALAELPRVFDALLETSKKIGALLPHPIRSPGDVTPPPAPLPSPMAPTVTPPALPSPPVSPPAPPPLSLSPPGKQTEAMPAPQAPPGSKSDAAPDFDPPDDTPVESNSNLKIYEGVTFKLAGGRTYYLDAPLGYTVGYYVSEGSLDVYRDGKLRYECYESGFKTFARVSRFSVISCTPTAVLKVVYIRAGNEIRR